MVKLVKATYKLQDYYSKFLKYKVGYLKYRFGGRWIPLVACYLLITLLFGTTGLAKDINFEVTVNKNKVSLGSSVQLNLSFYGTQDVAAPDLPDIEGFTWQYLGPSTRMSIVNGKVSTSITHMYILIPLKAGKFSIPAISIQYQGKTYKSDPIPIEVVQGPSQSSQAGQKEGYKTQPQELEDRIFLVMEVGKKKAYINEIVPVTVKLYINKLAVRDIQYPDISHEGFALGEFSQPKQYQEVLNGVVYDVIEFNTEVFAMRPGKLTLGPAQIKCDLIVKKERKKFSPFFDDDFFDTDIFDDFFARYERYPLNLQSLKIPVTVLALPSEGRPDSFTGAVGSYKFSLQVTPREVKVGDPITLKMVVRGEGNFKTVSPPSLNLKDEFKVYEPEIKLEEDKKTFEQVIIPKNEKINKIPQVSFSFFNPEKGEYQTITKGPVPIKVKPLPESEKLKVFEAPESSVKVVHKKEILGRDIIYIKDSPGPLKPKDKFLYKNKLFLMLQVIPIIAIISVLIFQRRKERIATDIRYARQLRAAREVKKKLAQLQRFLNSNEPEKFFDLVFKTLQEYLGDKFHMPTAGITSDVVEELNRYSIGKDVLDELKECFHNCDIARYAPSGITRGQMLKTFELVKAVIDKLEKVRV